MEIKDIANRLVDICNKGDFEMAQKELYADNAVSVEPREAPPFAKETHGLDAIFDKGKLWDSMLETFHGLKISEPLVAGKCFALKFSMDITMKGAGRQSFEELAVYTVEDGKIIKEEFFN